MKLSKIYSNKKTFKNIKFNLHGLNVIFADFEILEVKDSVGSNSHSIGKTKLVELLDFMLLKDISAEFFLKKKDKSGSYIFNGWVFYLEILLNDGRFLTIKRNVMSSSKISFKMSDESVDGFCAPRKWDFPEMTFQNAREFFEKKLNFDFFRNKDYNYRNSVTYSLRTQSDYGDVFKLSKFRGPDSSWKPFMFDLLGFNGKLLKDKYEYDLQIKKVKDVIEYLKKKTLISPEERDILVVEKNSFKKELAHLQKKVDKFNFFEYDQSLINQGVKDLENQIAQHNKELYSLQQEIFKIEKSLGSKFSFDLNRIKKLFEEAEMFFPEKLQNDYKKLVSFNKKLSSERDKFLKSSLERKQQEVESIKIKLEELNRERKAIVKDLVEIDTLAKYKDAQRNLVLLQGKVSEFDDKIRNIDQILEEERKIEDLDDTVQKIANQLREVYQSTENNRRYENIRDYLLEYYTNVVDARAFISWSLNSEKNVKFSIITKSTEDNKDNDKSKGHTYQKMLCVTFDQAILTEYSSESYFRFVYHDDVLSQASDRLKIRLLKQISSFCEKYDIQYIISALGSDLPVGNDGKKIEFDDNEIVLRLNNKKGPEGTLFGFEF